jgi:hypothetical protein
MTIAWGTLWTKSRKPLKTCWLITAGIVALYVGVIRPQERDRGINNSRAAGLAAMPANLGEEAVGTWRQMSILHPAARGGFLQKGISRNARYNVSLTRARLTADTDKTSGTGEDSSDRKLLRTATFSLIVKSPSQSAGEIVQFAQSTGGYEVSSQVSGADVRYATLTIRVPATKFQEVSAKLRSLSLRVESEGVESEDVSRRYVDEDARLRNLRAQKQQYLAILRKATTVKDTLEVSEKLNQVRGAIEEKQAEFAALSQQVETAAINITLRAEAEAQVFGLHWRPVYQLKTAAREGLDGLGDYVASMTFFAFYLPSLALWLFTILAGAAIGWRILRWAARILFRSARGPSPAAAAAH